jgi:hypothetical protein
LRKNIETVANFGSRKGSHNKSFVSG